MRFHDLRGLVAAWLMLLASVPALAQVCPAPGSYVTAPTTGVVNDYYQGNGNLGVGSSSLTLGALRTGGATTAMAVGDLLMVIQMQDASINTANNNSYGNGSGSGQGSTGVGNSGLYEFVRVTSVAGSTVGITPPLSHAYTQADATAATPQKRYQVVRVPQYDTLTAQGITTVPWNGLTGGVAAVDVRGMLTLGGGTVEGQANRAFFVAGKGFRGGGGRQSNGGGSSRDDYATPSASLYHGAKGEGIAGTPNLVANLGSNWAFRNTNAPPAITTATPATGYPGGSFARGAPANAGGGGTDGRQPGTFNDENAGGGGGGNYGPGGFGGRPWNDPLYDTGGRGGAGYAGTLAFNRVFLGGGGGAGGTNNGSSDAAVYTNQGISCNLGAGLCSSGAPGGGIVVIRARSITGGGIIDARGAHGYNVAQDAGGGGGAGGSIILQTQTGGNASIDVTGGDGGNAWAGEAGGLAGRHGPGGAGGGGFIAYAPASGLSLAAQVNGGAPGRTMSNLTPEENYGSTGFNGGITTFQAPNVPGVPPAAQCDPSLSLAKGNGVNNLNSPSAISYTFTVSNTGIGPTMGTVTVADKLPTGLSVAPGSVATGGPNGGSWSCNAANATDVVCNSTTSIGGGASVSFTVAVNVLSANGTSLVNRAQVTGGGDPNKPLAATAADAVTAAAACTGNNTPAGCALDTDTVLAPNVFLTKSNGTGTVVRGATTTYTLAVTNSGGTATSGILRIVDVLPAGMTFSGATPFTSGEFSCVVTAPNITCERTTALAAGASATLTLTVAIDPAAPLSLVNRARVGGGGDPSAGKPLPTPASTATCADPVAPETATSDPNTGCATDAEQVQFVSLSLNKDDGQPFVSNGGSTAYAMVVSNTGTAPSAGTITVRDVFPGTMSIATTTTPFTPPGTNGANWSCVRNSTTDVSCTSTVSIPAGGTSGFVLPANIGTPGAGVQQNNKARVGGGGDVGAGMVTSPAAANVTACISNGNPAGCATDLNTVQNAAEIRMTKSHPNPQARNVGDSFSFTLNVTNTGGTAAAAGSVQVVDVVPAGLTLGVITATDFVCIPVAQVVTCTSTAALPANSARTIVIPVTIAAGAANNLVNRAKVGTNGADPQNNVFPTVASATLCTGTNVPSLGCAADAVPLNADLQVTKQQRQGTAGAFQSALLGVPRGTTVQFQIDVTNNGPANVTGVTVQDTVPPNFSTVTWTCTATGTATCSAPSGAGNSIALSGNINSGAGNLLRLLVTAVTNAATTASGITNTVALTVPSGINDSTPANNTSSVATVIGITNLSLSKTNGSTSVAAGGTTSYTLVVSNTGNVAADGTRLYDPATAGLSCTAAPTCVATGATTSCPAGLTVAQLQNTAAPAGVAIPTLGPGGSVTITVACSVTASGQ